MEFYSILLHILLSNSIIVRWVVIHRKTERRGTTPYKTDYKFIRQSKITNIKTSGKDAYNKQ